MSDHDAGAVHLDQHVYSIKQLMNLTVVVLLAIEEVDDWINHDNVWVMKCDFIRDLLDVSIPHQVLSQSTCDNQVVIAHRYQVITRCESPVIHLHPLLEKLGNDFSL